MCPHNGPAQDTSGDGRQRHHIPQQPLELPHQTATVLEHWSEQEVDGRGHSQTRERSYAPAHDRGDDPAPSRTALAHARVPADFAIRSSGRLVPFLASHRRQGRAEGPETLAVLHHLQARTRHANARRVVTGVDRKLYDLRRLGREQLPPDTIARPGRARPARLSQTYLTTPGGRDRHLPNTRRVPA